MMSTVTQICHSDIPVDVLEVFFYTPKLATMTEFLNSYKPQCSECHMDFEDGQEYGKHIDKCSETADKSGVNYQLHMHTDNIVIHSTKIATMSGADVKSKPHTVCNMCGDDLQFEESLKWHTKMCKYYPDQFERYKKNTYCLFKSLIDSHKQLGFLFQTMLQGTTPPESSFSEFFKKEHQMYKNLIKELMDDAFLGWLKKKVMDSKVWNIKYRFTFDVREDGEDYSDLDSDDEILDSDSSDSEIADDEDDGDDDEMEIEIDDVEDSRDSGISEDLESIEDNQMEDILEEGEPESGVTADSEYSDNSDDEEEIDVVGF